MKTKSVEYIKTNKIGSELIDKLSLLNFSHSGTRRLCLHDSPEEKFHVMLIESKKNIDYPLHAHMDGPELIFMISGELIIEFFETDSIKPSEIFRLTSDDGTCSAVLIPQSKIHTTKAKSSTAIYLEVKLGPYSRHAINFISN